MSEIKVFTNRPMSPTLEEILDGVWLLSGDFKGGMNIYFVRDGDGVVQFDAGTQGCRTPRRSSVASSEG